MGSRRTLRPRADYPMSSERSLATASGNHVSGWLTGRSFANRCEGAPGYAQPRSHLRPGESPCEFQIVGELGAAQRGIVRGSEDGDHCADWQAQQGTATDACAVGDDIPEFHRAARREVLTAFQEDS